MSSSDKNLPPDSSTLPEALQKFLAAGKRKIETDTDEWTVSVQSPPAYLARALPPGSVLIADNGVGDHLFLMPEPGKPARFNRNVHVYWHEGPEIEVLQDNLDALLNPPAPTITKRPPVLYADGQTQVLLGDEVTARSFFIRRPARVVYVPGISKKNRDMEFNGLCWVALKFAKGARIGTLVDPKTARLGKSVRFIKRSRESVEEMGPGDRFE
jgi:hypothetical protein